MIKKILCLALILLMTLSFTACQNNQNAASIISLEDAEDVVDDFLDTISDADFDEENEYFTANLKETFKNDFAEFEEEASNALGISSLGKSEGGSNNTYMFDSFEYEILSSKEMDGKVILKVEISNKDLSFYKDLSKCKTQNEIVNYFQQCVNKGLMTVDEAKYFLSLNKFSDSDYTRLFDLLSNGETISEKLEFTVVSEGDKVQIDEIDDIKDLLTVITCNMADV